MRKIIFFGNGPLSEYALRSLEKNFEVIFHAHAKEDLAEAVRLKHENPEAVGVLASFGVLIPSSVLETFEPEGILNIHPSLLPLYRGASPIESAILSGDEVFGVSVMKLAPKMDAGPIYAQATLETSPMQFSKDFLYRTLAEMGAAMVRTLLKKLDDGDFPTPVHQDDAKATYCGKLDKSMSLLTPETDTAEQTFRKIVAFYGFPKAKYTFFGVKCIVLEAHIAKEGETAVLPIKCADGAIIAVDLLQPEGRKAMDAKSFMNGYSK